jgi:hypothetical protein
MEFPEISVSGTGNFSKLPEDSKNKTVSKNPLQSHTFKMDENLSPSSVSHKAIPPPDSSETRELKQIHVSESPPNGTTLAEGKVNIADTVSSIGAEELFQSEKIKEIKSMSLEEIEALLEDSENLTDEQLDVAMTKYDELIAEKKEQKQEALAEQKEGLEEKTEGLEEKTEGFEEKEEGLQEFEQESDLEQTIKAETSKKAFEKENVALEKGAAVEKVADKKASTLERGTIVRDETGQLKTPKNVSGKITERMSFDQDKGILKVTKENLKNYEVGQLFEFKDDNGVMQSFKINEIKELTSEEAKRLDNYLASNFKSISNYQSPQAKEGEHKAGDDTLAYQLKSYQTYTPHQGPDVQSVQNQLQTNRERIQNGIGHPSLSISSQVAAKRREKEQKEIKKRIEKDNINSDIKNMENQNRENKTDNEKREDSINKIKNETARFPSLLARLTRKLEAQGNSIPLATLERVEKGKEIIVRSKEILSSPKSYDLPALDKCKHELIVLNKELLSLWKQAVNEKNIQKTTGSDTKGTA